MQQGLSSALGRQSDLAVVQTFLSTIWGHNSTFGITALIPQPHRSVTITLSPVSWPCSQYHRHSQAGTESHPRKQNLRLLTKARNLTGIKIDKESLVS